MRAGLILAALPLLAAGCVQQKIEQGQIRGALVAAGLTPELSQCMAHRLVDQLTTAQLRKLAALKALRGPSHSVGDYIAAVQRINDQHVVQVTISSAALCATGLER